ncbi:Gfo/Idh/MocA family protein [Azospirillum sp. ST 5-10]|uniref:Gfo/Idh/MocA family protein n=1 Tax=unclassified Azospirillum TaxID=2630922 RepID=UPI003F4A6ED1
MTIEGKQGAEGKEGAGVTRRLRLGMVGGGRGAFIGAVHRIAARLDDRYELVAGALSADPQRARESGADLRLDPARCYADFREMARAEAARPDGIDVAAVVTPNHVHHDAARAFLDAGIHVICDKPMTTTVADAEDLAAAVERSGLVFALTHNYTGYPMVRQARAMVEGGLIGTVRVVQVEYPQDWLTTRIEESGQKQAAWRTDPARSGVGGCIGDIGTHAFNLAEFVSGQRVAELAAELTTFVAGRPLDDHAQMLLRFAGGARGMLWASQVAPGNENGLRLRVYGDKGGLEWFQEQPNHLRFAPFGEPPRLITRAGPGADAAAGHATRIPSGHPEGYLEGFAVLYRDTADLIAARAAGRDPDPQALLVPGVRDGVRGVRFIHAAVASSRGGATWTPL